MGDYLSPNQTPEERVEEIYKGIETFGSKELAEKFKVGFEKGWYLLSSPVWANFGKSRGLPISCFGSYIEDNMDSILDNVAEVGIMTKVGGGTSGYFGNIRPRGSAISTGGTSDGVISFMRLFDTAVDVCKQAKVRRGVMGCYLPIDHLDIFDFLKIKHEGSPIQHLFFAVVVKDEWMKEMIAGDEQKREVWAAVLKARTEVGMPYILFYDNVNNNKPQVYKDLGMDIVASNVCSEIMLPSSPEESFVCCLSSMNLLHYDEWKDTDAVRVLSFFLDAVLNEFIFKGKNLKHMQRAIRFSENHRAIGIGATGWHSLLQSKNTAFESLYARSLADEIFRFIDKESLEASKQAAKDLGEPPLLKGRGERWTTRISVAPNTSSAFILGQVSQSIEPYLSNYYIRELAKAKATVKNPWLEKLLEEKGKNNEVVWDSILKYDGSVQHLDFLTDQEKSVFKTASEIGQREIVVQAAIRQKHIDQGQSLNLFIPPDTPTKELNKLHIFAWESGIKSLYYQYSTNAAQKFLREIKQSELMGCAVCEG